MDPTDDSFNSHYDSELEEQQQGDYEEGYGDEYPQEDDDQPAYDSGDEDGNLEYMILQAAQVISAFTMASRLTAKAYSRPVTSL